LTRSISPGFFKTFRIPLVAGRDFDERDAVDKPLVVVVSKSTAQRLFPNEDPLGKRIYFGTDNNTGLPAEVIGIVGDVRSIGLDRSERCGILSPMAATLRSIYVGHGSNNDETGSGGRFGAKHIEEN
jgi:hypothetical protein